MNDDELHRFLRSHAPGVRLPGSWKRSVWARIGAGEASVAGCGIGRLVNTFLVWLTRPWPAVLVTALAMAAGAVLGLCLPRDELCVRGPGGYLQSINPLAPAHRGGAP